MIDFTLNSYKHYLNLIKAKYNIFTVKEYFLNPSPTHCFCILRHDVDRMPHRALEMAKLEQSLGLYSTYFFRTKKFVMNPKIISQIYKMGHEIGYHYESLSNCKGNMDYALKDFEANLNKLRQIVPIDTIAMHGSPLSGYDNRDLWKDPINHRLLKERFGILGEIYLDIDYFDVAYISDTGRNWQSGKSNVRDHVATKLTMNIKNHKDLIGYLKNPHPKLVFQTHPERWTNDIIGFAAQFVTDNLVNFIKGVL